MIHIFLIGKVWLSGVAAIATKPEAIAKATAKFDDALIAEHRADAMRYPDISAFVTRQLCSPEWQSAHPHSEGSQTLIRAFVRVPAWFECFHFNLFLHNRFP
jgi:hypothetical protein